jgi:hypothetical protein
MIKKIDWPELRETLPLHQKVFLDYISRLTACVESYKNGEINVDTALKTCNIIFDEIDDPDFPFFAVRNFRELFSIIFYQLPKISALRRVPTLQSEEQRKVKWWKILSYDGIEKRKYKRIEKPFMAGFRARQYEGHETVSTKWDKVAVKDLSAGGMLFIYNKNLGLDSLLDLKIDESKYTPTINCVGKIIRIDKPIPISIFGIAIEFTEIEEHVKEMINTTLLKRY